MSVYVCTVGIVSSRSSLSKASPILLSSLGTSTSQPLTGHIVGIGPPSMMHLPLLRLLVVGLTWIAVLAICHTNHSNRIKYLSDESPSSLSTGTDASRAPYPLLPVMLTVSA